MYEKLKVYFLQVLAGLHHRRGVPSQLCREPAWCRKHFHLQNDADLASLETVASHGQDGRHEGGR